MQKSLFPAGRKTLCVFPSGAGLSRRFFMIVFISQNLCRSTWITAKGKVLPDLPDSPEPA